MDRAARRGIGAVVVLFLAVAGGCLRLNPWWDEAEGGGAGSGGETGTGDGGSDGDAGDGSGGGSSTNDGGGSGGGSSTNGGDGSSDGGSTEGSDCPDGVPVPGVLCHGDPIYLDFEGAYAVAAGDVNADGHADVVAAGATATWVLLGDGSGALASPLALPGIQDPRDAAIEDLSLDGVNDFVIVGATDGQTMAVYRSDGAGGHADPDVYDLGIALHGVAPADLDGQGDFGLYAADAPGNRIAALQHTSNGFYDYPWSVAVGTGPLDVADGDMNGDNTVDLVAVNFGDGTVSVLRGDGTGGLTELGPFSTDPSGGNQGPSAVVLADCTRDGSLDVVVVNELSAEVAVMANDGTGVVSVDQTHAVGLTPYDVTSGDLDGDGQVDIVSADHDSETISVLLADGAGGLSAAQAIGLEGQPRHVATADLDEDGIDDWVVTCSEAGWIAYAVSGL